jgi:phage-related protein
VKEKVRFAKLYKNYFLDFYLKLDKKTRAKVDWTIKMIEYEKMVPVEYFQKLKGSDGIWEIRVKLGSNIYRVLCFFDEDQIIVLENGFQKKIQKTPKSEIRKAEKN